jgi:DNA-binding XRE family transcriptional regulator
MTNLKDILETLPSERQAKISARTAELMAEKMTLQQLRSAYQLTQQAMAERLKVRQETISRLEKRVDMLLSTLGSYISATGGELKLIAEFPDRPPVVIRGLSGLQVDTPVSNAQAGTGHLSMNKKPVQRSTKRRAQRSPSTPPTNLI